ncbi:MAG: DUF2029 domain-containing protein [Clostridia bacterium]|nr:DUF2029 domain-containing protein [Clostridia bacterium]
MKKRSSESITNISGAKSCVPHAGKPRFKELFYVSFCLFIAFFLLTVYVTGGGSLRAALFQDTSDTFMDHYNSVVYNGVDDPYEILVVYPPLASILYKVCNMIIPADDYGTMVSDPSILAQERAIKVGQSFVFQFILYAVFSIIIFVSAVLMLKKGGNTEKLFFVLVTVFSSPFLYMADRGNNVLLPVAFSIFFLIFFDHKNKVLRELSLISLAVAIGLKIYPAAFLVLFITNRKYKELLRELGYVFITLILPFFIFFNGFSSMKLMLRNLMGFDAKRTTEDNIAGQLDFKRMFFFLYGGLRRYTGITVSDGMRESYANICRYGMSAICGLGALFSKKQWKQTLLLSCVIYGFPGSASTYILLFLIIPTALFLDTEKTPSFRNYAYLSLMVLAQVPVILKSNGEFSRYWPTKVSSLAVGGIVLLAFIEMILAFISWNENRRRDGKPFFRTARKTLGDYFKYMLKIEKKSAADGPSLTLFDVASDGTVSESGTAAVETAAGSAPADSTADERKEDRPS